MYEYESTCSSHEEQWGIDIDNSIMFGEQLKRFFIEVIFMNDLSKMYQVYVNKRITSKQK